MHIALICPQLPGHLNPMTTLGQALVKQGHRVSIAGFPELNAAVKWPGLETLPVGRPEIEAGEYQADLAKLGQLRGYSAVRFTGVMLRKAAAVVLRDAPQAFRDAGVEGVVVDQVSPAGASVAQVLGLPFVIVCNALALNVEPGLPPPVFPWPYRTGVLARCRNHFGNWLFSMAARTVYSAVNDYRAKHGLPREAFGQQDYGELVQVAQQPGFFDFRRERLPDHFHYTGPWHQPHRDQDRPFPWDRLDGRPLLYASLGTVQNRTTHLYSAIAGACEGLDVQLVLALGRPEGTLDCPLPRGAIVVPYAPQVALLQKAKAVITHAGLNTALETLARGLPMVAIPLTNDQPGVARRLEMLGAARVLQPHSVTKDRLQEAILAILNDPQYRAASQACQQRIQSAPTAEDAARLVSRALTTRTRITRKQAVGWVVPTNAGSTGWR